MNEAMTDCLAGADVQPDRAAQRRNAKIIRRLVELEESRRDRPLYVTEVCFVLQVNQRTLHHLCSETLGMGPKQYLQLRRLRLVHGELRRARSGQTTVTAVATQYGFWELGRFAVAYRQEFGQSPSVTLQREYHEAPNLTVPGRSAKIARFGP